MTTSIYLKIVWAFIVLLGLGCYVLAYYHHRDIGSIFWLILECTIGSLTIAYAVHDIVLHRRLNEEGKQ